MNNSTQAMIETLVACPLDEMSIWAKDHPDLLNLAFLEECKKESDSVLWSDPNRADALTERMMRVAKHAMGSDSLIEPLAAWARGNWASYHDPSLAVQLYQTALDGYAAPETSVEMARILSNMVGVSLTCARFQEALDAYQMALPILEDLTGADREYLLTLRQNHGVLLHYLGRYEEAIETNVNAKKLAEELNYMDYWGEIQVNQAYTMAMMGELNRCEGLLLQSRQIATDYNHRLTVARIDLNLGILYTAQGRPANALLSFHHARQVFSALKNSMDEGSVLLYEAHLLEKMGAWKEARQSYQQARVHFTALDMQFEVGITLTRGAAVSRRYGEYGQAKLLLEQASSVWTTLNHPVWQAQTVLEQVALTLAYRQSEAALSQLTQCKAYDLPPALAALYQALLADTQAQRWQQTNDPALYQASYSAYKDLLTYSEQHGERYMKRRALAGLGELMQESDRVQAYSLLEKAVDCDEQIRQTLSVQELKASFQHQSSKLLPLLAKMAMEDGQPDRALQYIWRAKGGSLLELFQSAQEIKFGLEDSTSSEMHSSSNQLSAEIEQTRQDLASHQWQVLREATSGMPESVVEWNRQEIRRLEEHLHELRRQRNHALSATSAFSDRQADPVPILQTIDVDVLIEYICCENDILAVRVDCPHSNQEPIRYQAIKLADLDTLLDLADELEMIMSPVLSMPSYRRAQQLPYQLAECRPLLRDMYDYLIAPLGKLPANAKLLIAPDGPLHHLPFSALWDGQAYLTQRYALEMTPTAALAMHPTTIISHHPPLVIGASSEGYLPSVQKEVEMVHEFLPESTVFMDDPQSLHHLSNLAVSPRILHLACHTVKREDMPLFTALQLAENFLSVEQCYELPLQGTQLATLSSCYTGSGMESGGSLLAFQPAFFVAGVQQIVSSLWPVNDEAASHWMTQFYTHLAAGIKPAAALQHTQQTLMNEPAYAHPAIWAAFICSRRW